MNTCDGPVLPRYHPIASLWCRPCANRLRRRASSNREESARYMHSLVESQKCLAQSVALLLFAPPLGAQVNFRQISVVLPRVCHYHGSHSTISKVGTEARLQGCLSVLAAILQDGADDYTAAFITRQLRLLIENSSGQHGMDSTSNVCCRRNASPKNLISRIEQENGVDVSLRSNFGSEKPRP